MFQKMNVPILGIVENMSGFTCPHCGNTSYIFGRGGAEDEARELGVPVLAQVPLIPALVTASDEGNLVKAIESIPELSKVYSNMASRVAEQIHLLPVS